MAAVKPYQPHPLLRNADAMTVAAAYWPRRFRRLSAPEERLFDVADGVRLLARCHWQSTPSEHPLLLIVHGLEGSSESHYVLGTAEKAFASGFNVVRLNQRNCGGSERLTPTLYHSGLSGDVRAVADELADRDSLPAVFLTGFSMGGNLVLKAAGEWRESAPRWLGGVCAVCPAMDLAACADCIDQPRNLLYRRHFVRSLKASVRRKASLFPGIFSIDLLDEVRTIREFDEIVTARHFGFDGAAGYYERMSARNLLENIRVPTLILTAEDDPLVPFATFSDPKLALNPHITLEASRYGGHCGFIARDGGEARFWAESRILEFCRAAAAR